MLTLALALNLMAGGLAHDCWAAIRGAGRAVVASLKRTDQAFSNQFSSPAPVPVEAAPRLTENNLILESANLLVYRLPGTLDDPRSRALKFRPHTEVDRLKNEAANLRALSDLPFVPQLYAEIAANSDREISWPGIEVAFIEGPTLEKERRETKKAPDPTTLRLRLKDILNDALEIATMIHRIHQRHFYVLDLKPSNMIRSDRGFVLIDLETLISLRTSRPPSEWPSRLASYFFGAPELLSVHEEALLELKTSPDLFRYFDYYSLAMMVVDGAIRTNPKAIDRSAARAAHALLNESSHKKKDQLLKGFSAGIDARFDADLRSFLGRLTTPTNDYPSAENIQEAIQQFIAQLNNELDDRPH